MLNGYLTAMSYLAMQTCQTQTVTLKGGCRVNVNYGGIYSMLNPWYWICRASFVVWHPEVVLQTVYDPPHWSSYSAMWLMMIQLLILINFGFERLMSEEAYAKLMKIICCGLHYVSIDLTTILFKLALFVLNCVGELLVRVTQ